jgi:tetratricopeptide (TPR) repeat protein
VRGPVRPTRSIPRLATLALTIGLAAAASARLPAAAAGAPPASTPPPGSPAPGSPAPGSPAPGSPAPARATDPALATVQELLDGGRATEALARLEPLLRAQPRHPQALLLRSTAHFMNGDLARGAADLEQALALDPGLRQGWLNLAGLRIAEKRYDDAYAAMRKAQELAPQATENDLNLGAVELLRGRVAEASTHFQAYLGRHAGSADASYLVATNYAMAGYAALATQHLTRAIELDERSRLRARTDANFATLAGQPAFERLLTTDSYRPPAGSYHARRVFQGGAQGGAQGGGEISTDLLLQATLDALQLGKHPFDPQVEVTPGWALVWGEMRVKVARSPQGGVVELSAPAQRFTPAEWQERSEKLLREIATRLALRSASRPEPAP